MTTSHETPSPAPVIAFQVRGHAHFFFTTTWPGHEDQMHDALSAILPGVHFRPDTPESLDGMTFVPPGALCDVFNFDC